MVSFRRGFGGGSQSSAPSAGRERWLLSLSPSLTSQQKDLGRSKCRTPTLKHGPAMRLKVNTREKAPDLNWDNRLELSTPPSVGALGRLT